MSQNHTNPTVAHFKNLALEAPPPFNPRRHIKTMTAEVSAGRSKEFFKDIFYGCEGSDFNIRPNGATDVAIDHASLYIKGAKHKLPSGVRQHLINISKNEKKELIAKIKDCLLKEGHPYQKTAEVRDLIIQANKGNTPSRIGKLMENVLKHLSIQKEIPKMSPEEAIEKIKEASLKVSNGRPSAIMEHLPKELIPLAQKAFQKGDSRKMATMLYLMDQPNIKPSVYAQIIEGRQGLISSKYLEKAVEIQKTLEKIETGNRKQWAVRQYGENADPENITKIPKEKQLEITRKILSNNVELLPEYIKAGAEIDIETILDRVLGKSKNDYNKILFDRRFYRPQGITKEVIDVIFQHREPKDAFLRLALAERLHELDPEKNLINQCGMNMTHWIMTGKSRDISMLTPDQRKSINLLEKRINNKDQEPTSSIQKMINTDNRSLKQLHSEELTPKILSELLPMLPDSVKKRGLQHLPESLSSAEFLLKKQGKEPSLFESALQGIKEKAEHAIAENSGAYARIKIRLPKSLITNSTKEEKELMVKLFKENIPKEASGYDKWLNQMEQHLEMQQKLQKTIDDLKHQKTINLQP
jgi:hypothetical protein